MANSSHIQSSARQNYCFIQINPVKPYSTFLVFLPFPFFFSIYLLAHKLAICKPVTQFTDQGIKVSKAFLSIDITYSLLPIYICAALRHSSILRELSFFKCSVFWLIVFLPMACWPKNNAPFLLPAAPPPQLKSPILFNRWLAFACIYAALT